MSKLPGVAAGVQPEEKWSRRSPRVRRSGDGAVTSPPNKTNPMKTSTSVRALAALSLAVATSASAQIVVSNVASAPGENVTINQALFDASATVQARDQVGSVRSVSQTFTWNSDLALDGVGFRFASAQNTLDPVAADRVWRIDIQQISGNGRLTAASIITTVASLEFTLTPASINPGSYTYLDFVTDLNLTNGATYGLIVHAVGPNATAQRLFFNRSTDASSYTGGIAAQQSFAGDGAYGGTYGGLGYNLTFYMTTAAIPEPSSAATFAALGALGSVALRRRRHVRG